MKLQPKRKIILLAMAYCIVLPVILTGNLTADDLDHVCTGGKIHPIGSTANTEPDCPICQKIEAAEIFLKALKLARTVLFFTVCFVFLFQIPSAYKTHGTYLLSPVALKVRFNN